MSIVIDAHVSGESLLSQGAERIPTGTRAEFDCVVPIREMALPYLRVRGDAPEQVANLLRECDYVVDVVLLDEDTDEQLYAISWREPPSFVRCLREADGALLRATVTADTWSVECRLPTEAAVRQFESACTDEAVELSITRISRQGIQFADTSLTDEQRAALSTALAAGYFEVPRHTTLVELAHEFGVSDSALSQRLRRGIRSVLQESDVIDAPR